MLCIELFVVYIASGAYQPVRLALTHTTCCLLDSAYDVSIPCSVQCDAVQCGAMKDQKQDTM